MERLLNLAIRHTGAPRLAGNGIELGAGCALLSALVARSRSVDSVLALEVCEKMAELVVPKVSNWILGSKASKVIPVVGSFNDIQLPDCSLDFALEIDSLHHSGDLERTLRECARVLKPGGVVLCFDRCHPNSVSDVDVKDMLDMVYSREFLAANHYPVDINLTRRDNGEHEYRLYEWERAFAASGLSLLKTVRFAKAVSIKRAVKSLLAWLSPNLLPRLVSRRAREREELGLWLRQKWRQLVPTSFRNGSVLAPKETTVFYLRKS